MARAARNPDTGLTDREERFVELVAYNPDMNYSDAYREAYSTARMKPETVNNKAHELAHKAHIRARIAELRLERAERTKIDADWLLKRLAEEATADMADLYTESGSLKPVHEWPLIWRQGLVQGVEVQQEFIYEDGERIPDGVVIKVRQSDRAKRLEMIGKHIDVMAFKEQKEVTVNGLAEGLKLARERAKAARK